MLTQLARQKFFVSFLFCFFAQNCENLDFFSKVVLVLQRTFNMVSFCPTVITEGGQNERAYCHGACDGVDPAGH